MRNSPFIIPAASLLIGPLPGGRGSGGRVTPAGRDHLLEEEGGIGFFPLCLLLRPLSLSVVPCHSSAHAASLAAPAAARTGALPPTAPAAPPARAGHGTSRSPPPQPAAILAPPRRGAGAGSAGRGGANHRGGGRRGRRDRTTAAAEAGVGQGRRGKSLTGRDCRGWAVPLRERGGGRAGPGGTMRRRW